jgi:hypothetical protein
MEAQMNPRILVNAAPSSGPTIPATTELFELRELAQRHPTMLSEQRLRWALRNRNRNGLSRLGAVFETQSGTLLIHEPPFVLWWLGLEGRSRPRAGRRAASA